MSTMNLTRLAYYAAIGWTIIMFIGCSWPTEKLPDEVVSISDKGMHIAIFAPFAVLWRFAGKSWQWTLLAGLVFGLFIEIWQGITPFNRSFDLIDAVADGIGTAVGLGLAWLAGRFIKL
ncbi:hypothetical protein GCM10028817_42320 [Spirosoma pomorum]